MFSKIPINESLFPISIRTSSQIIDKVHEAAVGALKSPQVLELYKVQGLNATPMTTTEFRKYFAAEKKKWADVVREAKITQQ